MENYVSLNRIIGKNYNELNISVDYQKSQTNYLNGQMEWGGIYVYIKPIKRAHGVFSCTMLGGSVLEDGFKVKAVDMSRNNRRKVERFNALFTQEVLENIRDNYERENFTEIVQLIRNMGANFK